MLSLVAASLARERFRTTTGASAAAVVGGVRPEAALSGELEPIMSAATEAGLARESVAGLPLRLPLCPPPKLGSGASLRSPVAGCPDMSLIPP